jgi:peptidoglycan/xylan/chitin deacetylase (PgdA/CDA1 family)
MEHAQALAMAGLGKRRLKQVRAMTRYIAAYDTERAMDCLAACRGIREVHERFGFPGTFFVVGKRLEEEGEAYRSVLGDCPLFEVASHTYSHKMLRDHPFCGPAAPEEMRLSEIREGKALVEEVFDRPCVGLRPGCGFDLGLRGDPWVVAAVADAGFGYVSSLLWGPEMTMPALLECPFTYEDDGRADLWELPAHGWQDNLIKAHNLTVQPKRIVAWPSPFPEAMRLSPISTAREEFELNRITIDRAVEDGLPYVSLIWHPWSLARFDPEFEMLEQTFAYVRDSGMEATTFEDEWRKIQDQTQPQMHTDRHR